MTQEDEKLAEKCTKLLLEGAVSFMEIIDRIRKIETYNKVGLKQLNITMIDTENAKRNIEFAYVSQESDDEPINANALLKKSPTGTTMH